ncbi:MAG: hypothetical protein AABY47_09365 [Pseudomonadota bacterium]
MKEVSRGRWVAKLGGAVLASFLALPAYAQLMLAHEGHHDAGGCTITNAEFPIAFSGYEVPDNDLPPMHSFCSNIPSPGRVQLTVELSDWDSREIPLAVRLVKAGHGGHSGEHNNDHGNTAVSKEVASNEEDHSDHVMEHDGPGGADPSASEHGINYIPYMKHPSGIIVISAALEKGHYEILLERKDNTGNIVVAGRIPFGVGMGDGHGSHGGGIGVMEILLMIAVAGGGAAFYIIRREKASEAAKKS